MMERYIAVDNVCAWPNLTALPDGTLLATLFNQPNHGGCEGDTVCWASEDAGRSWTFRGTAAPHAPGTNPGLNHAAGLARDGSVVVVTTARDNRPPPGKVEAGRKSNVLPPLVCRSQDEGRTWEQAQTVRAPDGQPDNLVAFGPILTLADGMLGVPMHVARNAYFYQSADDGRTWEPRALMAPENYNETCAAVIGPGRLLAAARTYEGQQLDLFGSEDDGRSWEPRGPLTLSGQIPGNLLKLADGRILLTYGLRNPALRGLGYRLSTDDGLTWSRPGVLLNYGLITDGGYPASLQLADGTLVTAYYAGAVPAHMRYHMGILRWTLEDLAEPHPFTQSYAAGTAWHA